MNYYVEVLKKYAVFTGRARRAEYWYFVLVNFVVGMVLNFIGHIIHPFALFYWLYTLATIVPSLAVGTRRLHDTNRSGWWLLICCIPLIGAIILIFWLASDSQSDANQYGPNPKAVPTT